MLKKLLPVMTFTMGLAGGGTAALMLSPDQEAGAQRNASTGKTIPEDADTPAKPLPQEKLEFVKLPTQFVVPVILDARVRAMVILTIAIEIEAGQGDTVRALEPKLRDEFLAELFGIAAHGGFTDDIITRQSLDIVKRALSERAKTVLGVAAVNVLVTDMARQDTF